MDTEYAHRLVLLRHAKADYPDGVPDHERPLSARGRRDAPAAGLWLAGHGYCPDAVVCSTALRTRQTWELVAAGLASPPRARYEPRVYEATVLGLLMLVREFPDDQGTVLIVGHNPGVAELTVGLADPPPAPPSGFPTASASVLGIPGPWSSLAPATARLLDFATPADMKSRA